MTVVGADPGSTGAVAVLSGGTLTHLHTLTNDPADTWALFQDLLPDPDPDLVVIEAQRMRARERNPTAIGKLLRCYGNLELALVAKWPVAPVYVEAVAWQRSLGVNARTYEARKKAAHRLAKRLYPGHKILKPQADAVLIAHYAQQRLLPQRAL